MPKRVDHDARQREITNAVCRITLRGGLSAATFRLVAKEAGTSAPLVQYYFGTKENLLEVTQQHVGERSIARIERWIDATDGSPRAVLGAFLKSFVPADAESRMPMLMYIALVAQNVVGRQPPAAGHQRQTESQMMLAMVAEQLERGPVNPGVDPQTEAQVATGMLPGLSNLVLDGTMTPAEAYLAIDYHLDRLFPTDHSRKPRADTASNMGTHD